MNIRLVELSCLVPSLEAVCTHCAGWVGNNGEGADEILAAVSEFVFMADDECKRCYGQGLRLVRGKTVANENCLPVTSELIIPSITISPVLTGLRGIYRTLESDDFTGLERERHTICHEIGHAWDHFKREYVPPSEMTEETMLGRPFLINETADYFSPRSNANWQHLITPHEWCLKGY